MLHPVFFPHVSILNQLEWKTLPKIKHTVRVSTCKVALCQKTIDLCDQKQETKDSIGPPLSCPHNLNADWTMPFDVVVINCMMILEVVVNHFQILGHFWHVCTTILPVTSHLFAIRLIIGAIGWNHGHYVVGLFHGIDMKRDVIKPPSPWVCISNLFVVEMLLDLISMDESWPVPSLFDECTGKDFLFSQSYNPLQHAEPTIQYHDESLEAKCCQNPQQQSNGWTKVVILWLPKLPWMVLPFNHLYPPHDPTCATAHWMIFIPKRPWLSGNKHETRACELVRPNRHQLIEAVHIPWHRALLHILPPCFQHLLDLPKFVDVIGRLSVSKG